MLDEIEKTTFDETIHESTDGIEECLRYILVVDALNFCFWTVEGFEYDTPSTGLTRLQRDDLEAFAPHRLRTITVEQPRATSSPPTVVSLTTTTSVFGCCTRSAWHCEIRRSTRAASACLSRPRAATPTPSSSRSRACSATSETRDLQVAAGLLQERADLCRRPQRHVPAAEGAGAADGLCGLPHSAGAAVVGRPRHHAGAPGAYHGARRALPGLRG